MAAVVLDRAQFGGAPPTRKRRTARVTLAALLLAFTLTGTVLKATEKAAHADVITCLGGILVDGAGAVAAAVDPPEGLAVWFAYSALSGGTGLLVYDCVNTIRDTWDTSGPQCFDVSYYNDGTGEAVTLNGQPNATDYGYWCNPWASGASGFDPGSGSGGGAGGGGGGSW